jgi:hypothetical protein
VHFLCINCSSGSAFAQVPIVVSQLIDTTKPNLPFNKAQSTIDQVMRAAFLNTITTAIKQLEDSPNVRLNSKTLLLY